MSRKPVAANDPFGLASPVGTTSTTPTSSINQIPPTLTRRASARGTSEKRRASEGENIYISLKTTNIPFF